MKEDLLEAFGKLSEDLRASFSALRESVEGLDRRLVEVERRLDKRRSRQPQQPPPQLRVVQPDEVRDERSARSISAAILAGASERQRLQTGLSHRDVRDRLLRDRADALGALGYNLMLAFAAAQPTRAKQVTYAACAIGELTLAFEERAKQAKLKKD